MIFVIALSLNTCAVWGAKSNQSSSTKDTQSSGKTASGSSAKSAAALPAVPLKTGGATEALVDGWEYIAYTGSYGRFKVVSIPNAAWFDSGVFRYSLKGPNYEIFRVFNPENKAYIETSVAAYAKQWAPPRQFPPLKKVGSEKIKDLKCDHYQGVTKTSTLDCWYTQEVKAEKGLADAMCRLCAVPHGYGLPVLVKLQSIKKTSPEILFEVVKINRSKVAPSSLLVPKSYHYMKDQALFFFSDEDGSNTGVDEFMLSVPQKKKNK